MDFLTKVCIEYWELIKDRFGNCHISREDVKKSIMSYDVKNENRYEGNAFERMCKYQINKTDGFDCDVSYLTVHQYAIAFPHVLENERIIQLYYGSIKNKRSSKHQLACLSDNVPFIYRGDTMNSYNTTLHSFWKCWDDQEILENYQGGAYDPRLVKSDVRIYIELIHTIGNFIPVPYIRKSGKSIWFNGPRGVGSTRDYWDLALVAIYKWYTQNDDSFLYILLKNDDDVKLCKKWLDIFSAGDNEDGQASWDQFVTKNYMQSFVESLDDGHFGTPKELWKNHFKDFFISGTALPDRPEQFEEFFDNASMWILARGERIAEVIMQKLEEIPGCCPWKENNDKE